MRGSSNPIVVIGMQRSGTSALSGALARLGAFFGPDSLLYAGDANNPQGYYEHRKATILNLRILDQFQMGATSFSSLPENWMELPQSSELLQLLKEFIREEFDGQKHWALKHPLISLLLPIYNAAFSELGLRPRYVVCVRNPLEARESEARLDFEGGYRVMQSLGQMAVGSWLRYTLGAICEAAPYPSNVVMYDDLLANPRAVLESLLAGQPGWNPSEEAWSDAVSSIRADLRHNRLPEDALDEFPAIVRRTYEAARAAASAFDDASRGQSLSRFCDLYPEFKAWVRMLGDPPPPPGKLGLAWTDQGVQRVSEVGFSVKGGWQTVTLTVDAPPKSLLSGLIYGLPARVWIRRCVWKTPDRVIDATLKCGPASASARVNGVLRLDAAFEPFQVRFVTPGAVGPYRLEIEFLLETGPSIHIETSARLARQLEQCVSAVEALSARAR